MPETQIIIIAFVGIIAFFGLIAYILLSQIKNLKTELKKDDSGVLMEWLKDMKGSVDKNSDVIERQLKDQRTTLEVQMKTQRGHV